MHQSPLVKTTTTLVVTIGIPSRLIITNKCTRGVAKATPISDNWDAGGRITTHGLAAAMATRRPKEFYLTSGHNRTRPSSEVCMFSTEHAKYRDTLAITVLLWRSAKHYNMITQCIIMCVHIFTVTVDICLNVALSSQVIDLSRHHLRKDGKPNNKQCSKSTSYVYSGTCDKVRSE